MSKYARKAEQIYTADLPFSAKHEVPAVASLYFRAMQKVLREGTPVDADQRPISPSGKPMKHAPMPGRHGNISTQLVRDSPLIDALAGRLPQKSRNHRYLGGREEAAARGSKGAAARSGPSHPASAAPSRRKHTPATRHPHSGRAPATPAHRAEGGAGQATAGAWEEDRPSTAARGVRDSSPLVPSRTAPEAAPQLRNGVWQTPVNQAMGTRSTLTKGAGKASFFRQKGWSSKGVEYIQSAHMGGGFKQAGAAEGGSGSARGPSPTQALRSPTPATHSAPALFANFSFASSSGNFDSEEDLMDLVVLGNAPAANKTASEYLAAVSRLPTSAPQQPPVDRGSSPLPSEEVMGYIQPAGEPPPGAQAGTPNMAIPSSMGPPRRDPSELLAHSHLAATERSFGEDLGPWSPHAARPQQGPFTSRTDVGLSNSAVQWIQDNRQMGIWMKSNVVRMRGGGYPQLSRVPMHNRR